MNPPPVAAGAHADEPMEDVKAVALERDIRILHPSRMNGAKWFKNNTEVSTEVRVIIEGCFKGPWFSWKRVPPYYRESWFTTFKTKFELDPAINNLVKRNFEKLAATRLKGMISLAKSRGEKPRWILSDFWKVMSAYWRTQVTKDKSEKARSSRMSTRNGLGPHRHRAGSRSYAKVKDVLAANNEDSSFIAVMRKTHQKPDGTYVDERARVIAEKFDECVQERLSQMEISDGECLTIVSLSLEEKNEIYSKIVEPSKQGRIFGLGSIQNVALMSSETSSVSPPPNYEVGKLTRQMGELEAALKKSQEDNELIKKRLESMEEFCYSTDTTPRA